MEHRDEACDEPLGNSPTVASLPLASTVFRWSLDRIADGCLVGWVFDPAHADRPVALELRINGTPAAYGLANIYRADLVTAGLGNGRHGFRLRIPAPEDGSATFEVEVCAPGYSGTLYNGSFRVDPAVLRFSRSAAIFNRLAGDVSVLARPVDEPPRAIEEVSGPSWRSRGAQDVLLEPATDMEPAPLVSRYSDFARHRSAPNQPLPVVLSRRDQVAHLAWFVTEYGPSQLPSQVPLSAPQIEFLNGRADEMAFPFPTSRLMAFLLLRKSTPEFAVQTEDGHLGFCYWWATKGALELGVEDCLVPDYVEARLVASTPHLVPPDFRVSEYMRLRFEQMGESFEEPEAVVALAGVCVVEAAREPWRWRYIHPSVRAHFAGQEADDPRGRPRLELLMEAVLTCSTSPIASAAPTKPTTGAALLSRDLLDPNRSPRPESAMRAGTNPSDQPLRMIDGITVFGPVNAVSGLGISARRTVELLRRSGERVFVRNVDIGSWSPNTRMGDAEILPRGVATRINVLALNADTLPLAFAFLPAGLFAHSYNIGFFHWELSTLHAAHALALDLVDEIFVASEFCRQTHAANTQVPVTNVGSSVDLDGLMSARPDRDRWLLDPAGYCFLTVFDAFSSLERKNPLAVVQAFQHAFPKGSLARVELIIKTQNQELSQEGARWRQLVEICAEDPRIRIMNLTLPFDELASLKASCDCYVSLHRAEGFGYGPLEAMALGKPVILTGYSGTTDFANADNACLVRFDLVPVPPLSYVYASSGAVWAEPDVSHAAEIMRGLVADPEEGRRRGDRARAFVATDVSPEAVARRYAERIHAIRERWLDKP
jgi:glycosyltransferase involved in cell wall biosynthesis